MENKFDILKSHPGHVVTVILSAGMFWAGMNLHKCGDNSAEHLDLIAKKGQQQKIKVTSPPSSYLLHFLSMKKPVKLTFTLAQKVF